MSVLLGGPTVLLALAATLLVLTVPAQTGAGCGPFHGQASLRHPLDLHASCDRDNVTPKVEVNGHRISAGDWTYGGRCFYGRGTVVEVDQLNAGQAAVTIEAVTLSRKRVGVRVVFVTPQGIP